MLLYLIYRQNAFFPTCRKFRQVDSWLIPKFTAVVWDFRTTNSLLQCQLRFILNTIFFIFSFCMKFPLLCTDFACICQYLVCLHIRKPSFLQGCSASSHLVKSSEIRHFLSPIYLFLTSNLRTQSPAVLKLLHILTALT